MTAVGGSIQSISCEGRIFPVTADADTARDLGGFENKVEMNGDASCRLIKTAKGWKLDNFVTECSDTRGDQEFLQSAADAKTMKRWVVTYAEDGSDYSGDGQIVEGPEFSSNAATCKFSLAGGGKLKKQ